MSSRSCQPFSSVKVPASLQVRYFWQRLARKGLANQSCQKRGEGRMSWAALARSSASSCTGIMVQGCPVRQRALCGAIVFGALDPPGNFRSGGADGE